MTTRPRAASHALVRPPGASFANAISSAHAPIDAPLALTQHREYCQALSAAGLTVESLPADEHFPDGCFVQDPATVLDGLAVVGRMGAASRQGEEASVAAALARRFPIARITAPGTIEGGDVLVLPGRILVGLSERTNAAAVAQLGALLRDAGASLSVEAVRVTGYLHLLTAVNYIGNNILLALADYAAHPAFTGLDVLTVPADEAYAANVLAIGSKIIMPAGFPKMQALLSDRGFTLLPVPTTEFAKADGGVTCLSLIW